MRPTSSTVSGCVWSKEARLSILDDLIAVARRNHQDEQRRSLDRQAKKVRRIVGKDLYTLLDITHNEYEGVLEFTVRGVAFFLTNPSVGFGVWVCRKSDWHRPYGESRFVSDNDELLLFVDKYTRRGA